MADDRESSTRLSPQSEETPTPPRSGRAGLIVLLVSVLVVLAGLGWLASVILERLDAVDRRVVQLSDKADDSTALSRQALRRAADAEASAQAAAEGRRVAEAEMAGARAEAEEAREQATSARQAAALAEARAQRIQQEAQLELDRLEKAFRQIAETRRTALGLVMNLGSDYLKFDFDEAELHQEDRELLSRIAGILLSSQDYTISVNGHTDDVGTAAYNQKLSERRAQAVRDYLVEAGLPAEIFSVTGHGKALPLVPGRSEEARAKNRRVELGIVNTRIIYGRPGER
jgi:outer membrane protein OmpA-like peptidoglycan-associated protein